MKQKKERLRVPLQLVAEVAGYTYKSARHRQPRVEEAERILFPLIRQAVQKAKAEFNKNTLYH